MRIGGATVFGPGSEHLNAKLRRELGENFAALLVDFSSYRRFGGRPSRGGATEAMTTPCRPLLEPATARYEPTAKNQQGLGFQKTEFSFFCFSDFPFFIIPDILVSHIDNVYNF